MQCTPYQKTVIENIVTLHETGRLNGKSYGTVTNVRGDPGGLTYGKHQVTINGGGLYLMLNRYLRANGQYAGKIARYIEGIRAKNANVAADPELRALLVAAGNDPVMQQVQDKYFDDQYWIPALKFCDARGLDRALALAVVYDSTIHGSLYRIDKRIAKGLTTPQWILQYVEARRKWMATHSILILRRCVYRMDTFRKLYDVNNFDLDPPVYAHGSRADPIRNAVGSVGTDLPFEVPNATTQRILDLRDRGDDVAYLQAFLTKEGYGHLVGRVDGIFGKDTQTAVIQFQALYNLVSDGIVGPSTWRVIDQVDDG